MNKQCGTCSANILSCRSGYREYCFQLRAYVKPNELRCGGKYYQEDSEEDLLAWRDKPNWKLPDEEPPTQGEKLEKLVEEMREFCQCNCGKPPKHWVLSLITRVGQAYADGMPLPGEIGRGEMVFRTNDYPHIRWFLWRGPDNAEFMKQLSFIALSPSGIPVEHKEEEK